VISAVLFDLDGTLVETEELKALSYARAAVELRPDTVREEDVISAYADDLVGHPRQEVATALVQRFGLEEAAHLPWILFRLRRAQCVLPFSSSSILLPKCCFRTSSSHLLSGCLSWQHR
jgi:phosphoglycolate phosphatase-like HAD superfamily hydrolase